MPKTYKQKSIVSGMSINDIMNMGIKQFNKLTEPELRKVVGRLVSASNKRIRRMESSGIETPALRKVNKSGGVFSVKDKNLNQLRSEFSRAKSFLQSPTSSIKGYKEVQKKTVEGLKKQGIDVKKEVEESLTHGMTTKEIKQYIKSLGGKKEFNKIVEDEITKKMSEMFKAYEQLKELSPNVAQRGLKYAVLKEISESVIDESKTTDDIALMIHKELSDIYERESENDEFTGVSGFF